MATFNRGDVVKVKSGGPKMTVAEEKVINGKARVFCEWFVDNKAEKGTFAAEALEKA